MFESWIIVENIQIEKSHMFKYLQDGTKPSHLKKTASYTEKFTIDMLLSFYLTNEKKRRMTLQVAT